MLCKKCNTSISDIEKSCQYCGAKVPNYKRIKILTGVILAVLVGGSSIYILSQTDAEEVPEETALIDEALEDDDFNVVEDNFEEDTVTEDSEDSEDVEETDNVWLLLDEAVNKLNEYYDRYSNQVDFVTKQGYLYDFPSKAFVTIDDLIDVDMIDVKYKDERILILYLKPRDVEEITGITSNDNSFLEIYCAYETDQGFALASKNDFIAVISRSDFNKLLTMYNSDNGTIERPKESEKEYQNILDVISSYEFNTSGYDVRYMTYDERYAVISVSDKAQPQNINNYVLERLDNNWSVIISNFEDYNRFRININEKAPSLNLDLLPKWSLRNYILDKDYDINLIKIIAVSEGYLEDDDQLLFFSGADSFCYLEYESGKTFVAYQTGGTYEVYPVSDFLEAEEKMLEINSIAPTFLVRQK